MSELAEAWARITRWLQENAPVTAATIRPGATPAEVDALEAALGLDLPAPLREWFGLQGGVGYDLAGRILPSHMPLSTAECLRTTRMMREVYADAEPLDDGEDLGDPDTWAAGTSAAAWLPTYVAIASDGGGWELFVDTRAGDLHGCVTEFQREDSDLMGPRWPGPLAMLTDVADTLAAGAPGRGSTIGYRPTVVDGTLEWDPEDE